MLSVILKLSTTIYNIYNSCVGKIEVNSGEELYKMSRDELRDCCGVMEGIRLYSLLQRDRKEVCNNNCTLSKCKAFVYKNYKLIVCWFLNHCLSIS